MPYLPGTTVRYPYEYTDGSIARVIPIFLHNKSERVGRAKPTGDKFAPNTELAEIAFHIHGAKISHRHDRSFPHYNIPRLEPMLATKAKARSLLLVARRKPMLLSTN